MKEQFLIQVELHPDSRLVCDQADLLRAIQKMVESVYKVWGSGPEPAITVNALENSDEVDLRWLVK
ncbi:MAG TPA: hypothetical protein VG167_14930 [Verrucomicrobiae bacterium]|nr:hypothetical protein [Verrucomicrobiae bacterium]